ncbi:hypothetical protein [Thermococcus sp. Bubb.Bath]|uniref:hypothetical protein n=1 Tax=Thermococcus sp. Bubb.Bath TaxID=1638242 RepID=UPI00143936ED|nr:hypothetical protein [Thermococcus sp. Bubb.Bath]NJF24531.1 hypothetical protein [Thermococcus sp. Bubb.Bath]
MSAEVLDDRALELAGTGSGWATIAECRLKASDRGLELVSVDRVWFEDYVDDPAWLEEELEVWGIRRKFRAHFYRWRGFKEEDGESAPDLNRWYVAISDLEEAGELELWF